MLKKNEPDWIKHDGSSECPVPAGHDVEVRFGDLVVERDTRPESWAWTWAKGDPQGLRLITHYRDWTAFEQQQTSAGESVPYWAWKRAVELTGPNRSSSQVLQDFARYIAAHEPKGEVPKLLTEAEWRRVLIGHQFDLHEAMLRERGLIAPEPEPDALRDLAEELARESQDLNLPLRKRVDWFEAQLRARGVTAPARGEGV